MIAVDRLVLAVGCVVLGTTLQAGQHYWSPPKKTGGTQSEVRPITVPLADISGSANGVYCPDMTEQAVGSHDLGWLPSGREVTVVVESTGLATFDPVAAVIVPSVGTMAGGTVKTSTFYDNDSGGDRDPRITFVTPQAGSYFLLVGENSGSGGGCYRYQVSIR